VAEGRAVVKRNFASIDMIARLTLSRAKLQFKTRFSISVGLKI
jgi:hypothetical protein